MHARVDRTSFSAPRAEELRTRPARWVNRWVAGLRLTLERRRQRLRLAELDVGQLADIGLTRLDVERECRRWPWDGRA